MSLVRPLVSSVVSPLPDRLALTGVFAAGLGWSLSVGWARWAEVEASGMGLAQAMALIVAGGMATVLSLWFSVSAVMWAMGRVCGLRAGFRDVLMALSAASPILALIMPAAAVVLVGGEASPPAAAWILLAAGGAAFCAQVAAGLGRAVSAPAVRAWGCVGLTGLFCISFLSLYQ